MAWQENSRKARSRVRDAIPKKWVTSAEWRQHSGNSLQIPEICGLLSPAQIKITNTNACELLRQLCTGILTSYTVTEAFCARAAIAHQLVNCLTEFFPDEALQLARELDARFQETGPVGVLHGLPISIKDAFDMADKHTTNGFMAWKDTIAHQDSGIVELLRKQGAVFYVKTAMPQTGMALETNSNLYGRTISPFNSKLGAGGSSGGEAVLMALRGSPVGFGSDIGGSIRVPCAFNGLYGIRASSDRVPKSGMRASAPGQAAVKVSTGPLCHTMEDLKFFAELVCPSDPHTYEPSTIPVLWRKVDSPDRKLCIAVMAWDGVVLPHPPIRRAMQETAQAMRRSGHDVIEFEAPFDCWSAISTMFKLVFPSGFVEAKELIASAGEPTIPVLEKLFQAFDVQPSTTPEQMKYNVKQSSFKSQLREAWGDTARRFLQGRRMDVLICPVSPSAGYEHDFLPWWGYTTMFNITDFPSVVVPLKNFTISTEKDPKDTPQAPLENMFARRTTEAYDPSLFQDMPVGIQVVGLPYQDEELLAASAVIDEVMNGSS